MKNIKTPDIFNKYTVRITAETAKELLNVVQEIDYTKYDVGEILALNDLWAQLELILQSANVCPLCGEETTANCNNANCS